jgi:MFS family permease
LRSRLRTALGLEPNIVVLLLALFSVGVGEELWSRFAPQYLEMLGGGIAIIALYGALKDLLEAVLPFPGGWITDHFGRRKALTTFALVAAIGYAIYFGSSGWAWFLVGTIPVMAWSNLTLPTIFSVIADHLPHDRRGIGFSVQSLLKRIPIMIAPPIGGWLIVTFGLNAGMKSGFAVSLVLAVITALIVRRYFHEPEVKRPSVHGLRATWTRLDSRLKRLLIADVLARWAEGIPKVYVVLFVLDVLRRSPAEFGWLISLQMLTSAVLYLPTARLSDRFERKPFVLATFIMFALFPLVLVQMTTLLGLVAAFICAGLREVGEPARKALIVNLADADARGQSVGLYYLLRGLSVFPASLVGGWLWTVDPNVPFYAAFAVGAIGVVVYALWGTGSDGPRAAGTT